MLEILKALVAKASGSSAMQNGLAGGFWYKKAPQGQPMPYVIIRPPDGENIDYDTSKRYVEAVNYDIAVVGRKVADIAAIVIAWRDALNYQPLPLETGHVMAAKLDGQDQVDEAPFGRIAGLHSAHSPLRVQAAAITPITL
jgi:hypothetical protein